jgi:hypothetical protein
MQSSTDLKRSTAPEKKGSRHNPQHDGHLIHRSVPNFSPTTAKEQWGKVNSCGQLTTRLIGPISPTCDRYVQYLLAGANRTVLNRHRRGLQPWRCRLATYPLPDLPTSCPHFPLMAPPGLHFNHIFGKDQSAEILRTYGRHVVLRPFGHLP